MTETPETELTDPDPIEAAILSLVAAAPEGRSISPADVAKAVDPERFNRKFGHVRQAAIRLAKAGKVTILRKGKPVEDPESFKGVWRIGRA
ncbi:DUF3253 domain-containing protein [Maricaulis sp.]|jgi:Protein of unknown function (DUF3253)|uniref:DUF3253 domain-containing protein n=1 Tax=Maricaulis sp. TaxID=1486257 RepID=UPI0025E6D699|nr:DUF3253 domain-containing protein [Maricaulis sp.]MDF1768804.1 DUF3253 domain-containing protein [Maricaulis sp.]